MAIRGPQGPRPETAPQAREQPRSPQQRLMDFGAARTPQEAIKVMREILLLLAAGGFPVGRLAATGDPATQLASALKQLQQQEGLPQTGQLDHDTLQALDRLGLLPQSDPPAKTLAAEAKGRLAGDPRFESAESFVRLPGTDFSRGGPRLSADLLAPRPGSAAPAGTQKTRSLETEQARSRVQSASPDVEVDLRTLLGALKSAGFLGAGKGKEQLTDAVKKLQRVDGLPTTGRLDAQTADSLQKRGVIDAPTAQALQEQDPHWQPAPNAGAKGDSGGPGTTQVPSASTRDGRVDDGDIGASEDGGNNYAGDDNDDPRRGLANVDDDDLSGDLELEHWEVCCLTTQVEEALPHLQRDDDGSGPATYGWELRLYRPGVYAAKQPAEEVLHLVVTQAGPFDAVWQQALTAVNDKLTRYEPESPRLDEATLRQALQRARYR